MRISRRADRPPHVARSFAAGLLLLVAATAAEAGVRRVWAVNESEKVAQDDLHSQYAIRNSAWDGRTVRLFGARNEVLAVQVIVEADERGIGALSLALPELRLRGGTDRLVYAPPGIDPSESAGRPIQVFVEHYMFLPGPSTADWIFRPGSPAAPRKPVGWKPVQLVPENARAGRGGLPVKVAPSRNQAIWIEVYTGRERARGTYTGTIRIVADGAVKELPLELELLDFTLPDENSLNVMVYYEPEQPELYQGRNLDASFHRFAHRQRIELVHAYDEAKVQAAIGRFTGKAFTRAEGYEGPGEGVGNRFVPLTFYGPGTAFDDRASAWRRADEWVAFLERTVPGAITFVYMPDEPGPKQFSRIRALADNIHSNPGPGRRLETFATKEYVPELDGAVDIWCAPPQLYDVARADVERARGREYWTYNGSRPYLGIMSIDAPATDPRSVMWAAFKKRIPTFFSWHSVHWRHNSQKQGERNQNVWADPITFDNRGQPGKRDTGFAYGDGVLLYPGQDRIHPSEDRGIAGPISTLSLANYRRGIQDHLYLTLARKAGLGVLVDQALRAIVPRVFSEAGETIGFSEVGNDYEARRLELGRAIAAAAGTR